MVRKVITVSPDEEVATILGLMNERCIQHLPVVEKDHRLLGMISDRDIKKYVSPFVGSTRETPQDRVTLALKAESIMARDLVTCQSGDSLKKCTEMMLSNNIHGLPVVEKKTSRLLGLVTTTDLLKFLMSLL